MHRALLLLLPLPLACTSLVEPESELDDGGSSSGHAETSSSGDGFDPATSSPPPPATTGPVDETTGVDPTESASTGSDTCDFICESTGGADFECDFWAQDCPEGEKCAPWANDGGNFWNAHKCVPIDPDPDQVGEPCTVEGSGVSGIDSCEGGSMCWNVDPETNVGTCSPFCVGTINAPTCTDPQDVCIITGDAVLNLCIPTCDPVDPDACPPQQGCYPSYNAFVCAPDASGKEGQTWDACEFTNACDGGRVCVNASDVEFCDQGASGCCAPACDLNDPVCPDDTVCLPFYESGEAPPGYGHVGTCGTDPG